MKVEGQTIILDAGEEVTIKAREKETVVPSPSDEPTQKRLNFEELLEVFNDVLAECGYRRADTTMSIYGKLGWQYNFADSLYNEDHWVFLPSTYPLLYDYRGNDGNDATVAYNAMQAWILAMSLAELVPDSGKEINTQTQLFNLAYEIGGGKSYPLYNGKTLKDDPYAMREVGSVIQSICRGDKNISESIETYRQELGGNAIPASCWEELGYKSKELRDASGWRMGYRKENLGYCVNTKLFLPDAPGPRVDGTTVCELPWPYEQGQDIGQFTDNNYTKDKEINDYFVRNYDMMSQTPLSKWNSYPIEKQNRLVNVAATPPCTYQYMFGAPIRVKFDGIQHKSYDGKIVSDYFCFSKTDKDTGLVLDGPFSDLSGIIRYNAKQLNEREQFIVNATTIFDNFRFATQDPNYGRCRPGCACTREGGWLNPVPGADENELYNVDLTSMVADDEEQKEKFMHEDGLAYDSPRSYVSGHSAQIWGLALLLTQADNDNTPRPKTWVRKAFEYSVNRTIGRYHWNTDIIYGRLFGSMAVPILRAMTGLQGGLKAFADYVENPSSQGDWDANIIIKNETGAKIQSTGEIRLYIQGDDGKVGINTYLPNWVKIGAAYTFNVGENDFINQGIRGTVNSGEGEYYPMLDSYNDKPIIEVRVYNQDHWKSSDAGWKVTLDTSDQRCSPVLRKAGATYVIKIERL